MYFYRLPARALLLVLCLGIQSCQSCQSSKQSKGAKNVSFSKKTFEQKVTREDNEKSSLEFKMTYLLAPPSQEGLAEVINNKTLRIISSMINSGLNSRPIINTEKELRAQIDEYLNNFKSTSSVDTVNEESWKISITEEVVYETRDLLSLKFISSQNSNKNRATSYVSYLNVNKRRSEIITTQNLTSAENREKLVKMAELEFRRKYRIEPDQAFSNTEFIFFEDDKFSLPENFCFTKEGLFFVYNIYEIAPYSAGMPNFTLQYSKVKDLLNI